MGYYNTIIVAEAPKDKEKFLLTRRGECGNIWAVEDGESESHAATEELLISQPLVTPVHYRKGEKT
jgi:hypothetical protein